MDDKVKFIGGFNEFVHAVDEAFDSSPDNPCWKERAWLRADPDTICYCAVKAVEDVPEE